MGAIRIFKRIAEMLDTAFSGVANDDFMQRKAGAWTNSTATQVTADLSAMIGDSGAGGTKGLVPAPAAGDAAASKFLKADGTWATVSGGGGSGTVTSVAASFTGGIISVGGSPVTTSGTLALTVAGTSGGIPYFSSSSAWASSSALAAGGIVVGGGTGAAPSTVTAGATTEILVGGGASTAPVWTTATGTGAPVRAGSPTFTAGATFGAALTLNGVAGSKNYTLSNGNWYSSAVPYVRSTTANTAGILDVLANGTGVDSWVDIGSDFTVDNTNGEFVMVRKKSAAYAEVSAKGLGTGVGRALVLQDISTTGVGANGGTSAVGFNTNAPSEQYHAKYDQSGRTTWVVENASANAAAYSTIEARNGTTSSDCMRIGAMGTGWTTNGAFFQDCGIVESGPNLAGGMSILTRSGAMRFYTNGFSSSELRATISSAGALALTPGTLADTVSGFTLTATMPTTITGTTSAVAMSITGAGSSSFVSVGQRVQFLPGYTGNSKCIASLTENTNSGTGNNLNLGTGTSSPFGNSGLNSFATGTTTGANFAGFYEAENGILNIAVFGKSITDKNSGTNIAVVGFAQNAGTSPTQIAGYFGLQNATPTFASAALMCDNGSTTSNIFVARDNGTAVFTIADGGAVTITSSLLSTSATAGIGYATGAGGTVTQGGSDRLTGVTLNKVCGSITLRSEAGSTSWQSFTVTNSAVAATDTVRVCQKSGTDKYMIHVTAVGAGSFQVTFATTGGTTTEQPVFNFTVIKAVAA